MRLLSPPPIATPLRNSTPNSAATAAAATSGTNDSDGLRLPAGCDLSEAHELANSADLYPAIPEINQVDLACIFENVVLVRDFFRTVFPGSENFLPTLNLTDLRSRQGLIHALGEFEKRLTEKIFAIDTKFNAKKEERVTLSEAEQLELTLLRSKMGDALSYFGEMITYLQGSGCGDDSNLMSPAFAAYSAARSLYASAPLFAEIVEKLFPPQHEKIEFPQFIRESTADNAVANNLWQQLSVNQDGSGDQLTPADTLCTFRSPGIAAANNTGYLGTFYTKDLRFASSMPIRAAAVLWDGLLIPLDRALEAGGISPASLRDVLKLPKVSELSADLFNSGKLTKVVFPTEGSRKLTVPVGLRYRPIALTVFTSSGLEVRADIEFCTLSGRYFTIVPPDARSVEFLVERRDSAYSPPIELWQKVNHVLSCGRVMPLTKAAEVANAVADKEANRGNVYTMDPAVGALFHAAGKHVVDASQALNCGNCEILAAVVAAESNAYGIGTLLLSGDVVDQQRASFIVSPGHMQVFNLGGLIDPTTCTDAGKQISGSALNKTEWQEVYQQVRSATSGEAVAAIVAPLLDRILQRVTPDSPEQRFGRGSLLDQQQLRGHSFTEERQSRASNRNIRGLVEQVFAGRGDLESGLKFAQHLTNSIDFFNSQAAALQFGVIQEAPWNHRMYLLNVDRDATDAHAELARRLGYYDVLANYLERAHALGALNPEIVVNIVGGICYLPGQIGVDSLLTVGPLLLQDGFYEGMSLDHPDMLPNPYNNEAARTQWSELSHLYFKVVNLTLQKGVRRSDEYVVEFIDGFAPNYCKYMDLHPEEADLKIRYDLPGALFANLVLKFWKDGQGAEGVIFEMSRYPLPAALYQSMLRHLEQANSDTGKSALNPIFSGAHIIAQIRATIVRTFVEEEDTQYRDPTPFSMVGFFGADRLIRIFNLDFSNEREALTKGICRELEAAQARGESVGLMLPPILLAAPIPDHDFARWGTGVEPDHSVSRTIAVFSAAGGIDWAILADEWPFEDEATVAKTIAEDLALPEHRLVRLADNRFSIGKIEKRAPQRQVIDLDTSAQAFVEEWFSNGSLTGIDSAPWLQQAIQYLGDRPTPQTVLCRKWRQRYPETWAIFSTRLLETDRSQVLLAVKSQLVAAIPNFDQNYKTVKWAIDQYYFDFVVRRHSEAMLDSGSYLLNDAVAAAGAELRAIAKNEVALLAVFDRGPLATLSDSEKLGLFALLGFEYAGDFSWYFSTLNQYGPKSGTRREHFAIAEGSQCGQFHQSINYEIPDSALDNSRRPVVKALLRRIQSREGGQSSSPSNSNMLAKILGAAGRVTRRGGFEHDSQGNTRPYVAGDDVRQVDWKSSARSDKLFVRTPQAPLPNSTDQIQIDVDIARLASDIEYGAIGSVPVEVARIMTILFAHRDQDPKISFFLNGEQIHIQGGDHNRIFSPFHTHDAAETVLALWRIAERAKGYVDYYGVLPSSLYAGRGDALKREAEQGQRRDFGRQTRYVMPDPKNHALTQKDLSIFGRNGRIKISYF